MCEGKRQTKVGKRNACLILTLLETLQNEETRNRLQTQLKTNSELSIKLETRRRQNSRKRAVTYTLLHKKR